MKKRSFITVLIFLLSTSQLGVGIQPAVKTNISPWEQISIQSVDLSSAIKVAQAQLERIGKSDSYKLDTHFESITENDVCLFHVFQLKPQGYIVISSDYNLPPVLAYSLSHNFFDELDSDTMLLTMLISDTWARLKTLYLLPVDVINERHLLWNDLLDGKVSDHLLSEFRQWPVKGTTAYGGWLETSWNQDAPYNNFCPLDLDSQTRSVAGCPAVAMAQILNYHQTTNHIMFNNSDDYYHNYAGNQYWIDNDHELYDFPSFSELNSYLDTVISHYQNQTPLIDDDKAALVFACGVAANQVYHPTGSGTFGVDQAYRAYTRFGFRDADLLNEDAQDVYDRLQLNMKMGHPAHLAVVNDAWTAGHNLVVDGYNTDGYYHLNFGWGGVYNGWYLLPEELPYDLTVLEGVIVDIRDEYDDSELLGSGSLNWNAPQSSTLTGSFAIQNIGDTAIDWEIVDYPDWGTWMFTPMEGEHLAIEDGPVTINVTVVAPDQQNKHFTGHITIVNKNNCKDFCLIHVSLSTPKHRGIKVILPSFNGREWDRFSFIRSFLDTFIMRNPS
jgi:hypothetical protein